MQNAPYGDIPPPLAGGEQLWTLMPRLSILPCSPILTKAVKAASSGDGFFLSIFLSAIAFQTAVRGIVPPRKKAFGHALSHQGPEHPDPPADSHSGPTRETSEEKVRRKYLRRARDNIRWAPSPHYKIRHV